MRRERARWRLSAVLLTLMLAFGATAYRVAAGEPGASDTHRAPSAVMVTDLANTSPSAGKRDGQIRLAANVGHGAVVLFVVALSALLAALRRPHLWSPAATLSWLPPGAAGTDTSRGRAPPRLA